jgi:ABC-2 type transport system ATP-binding protein
VRDLRRLAQVFTVVLDDSDRTLRELLQRLPEAHDIEITSHSMDDAFLALTSTASTTERV